MIKNRAIHLVARTRFALLGVVSAQALGDAQTLQGGLKDAEVLEDARDPSGAATLKPASRLGKRVRQSNSISPELADAAATNTGKRGGVAKSSSPEPEGAELAAAPKTKSLGSTGKRGRPPKSPSPEPTAMELAGTADTVSPGGTVKRGRPSNSQSPRPEPAEASASKGKSVSSTVKRARVSKSQSPQPGVSTKDGGIVPAPNLSAVEDPIDDSEDDGSGPRGDASLYPTPSFLLSLFSVS